MPSSIDRAAARIEPEMARRVAKGLRKARDLVSINDLAMALQAKDAKRALALLSVADLQAALSPAGTTARDAVLKGGRVEAETLNRGKR